MDKIISSVLAVGLPAAITSFFMGKSGISGAPAFNSSLKTIGRGSMYRGAAVLLAIATIASSSTEYTIEQILLSIFKHMISKGETYENVVEIINKTPISKSMKAYLKNEIKENTVQIENTIV